MKKISFKDSKAIKITGEMRNSLDRYNQKQQELERANDELALLEEKRKAKKQELESLNLKALDSDKKVSKEANRKIKVIDKEMGKFQNDIQKINEQINGLLQKNGAINVPDVTMKHIKDLDKLEEAGLENNDFDINNQVIDNNDEVKLEEVSAENIDNNDSLPLVNEVIDNSLNEEPEVVEEKAILEPIVLTDSEQEENEESSSEDEVIVNPFLSQDSINNMWNDVTVEKDDEKVSNDQGSVTVSDKSEYELEIKKPAIFDDNSKFAKIADKVVSPSPLIPEGNDISLVPYDDYNDYVFKFGQNHYGKEALTPKEISDLSDIKDFLDGEAFEIERSKQYNNIEKENEELRDRITKIDDDYKKQVSDMRKEHFSNLDELGKLIDNANDIIYDNRTNISNLENKNQNLNHIIDNQNGEIDSLKKNKSELENTIDKLNADIANLEKIKEEHEEKIRIYESKFKEVLGIVREVKTDN